MFKLRESSTFAWPVVAYVPESGKHRKITFDAEFHIISQTQLSELMGEPGDEAAGNLRVIDAVLHTFTGIDVEDDDGNAVVDDHDERRRILCKYPFLVRAVSDAYAKGVAGYRTKN